MARMKINTTKMEILQVATRMFLEKGYSSTSIKAICDELQISTGNFTFYFPTKEDVLAVLVENLCNFQQKLVDEVVEEGEDSLWGLCLEFATMAIVSYESEIIRDFFVSAYSHPRSLEIIRNNDAKRAKTIFAKYCPDWEDNHFAEAEILVSGIEYATLVTEKTTVSMDMRIEGALNSILTIYNVPEETRRENIDKILSNNYYEIGKQVLKEFKDYMLKINENAFKELLNK